ncbi:MAG: AAA family ATPase [Chitinophagales bacterium]|nr:AAA family ATPase [Bacteroidota bacterium]MCB9042339.1 AAA family ATPase [Chitinophagales bacterium]
MNNNQTNYGAELSASEIEKFVAQLFRANEIAVQQGKIPTTLCIWGRAGVGKSELVAQIAQQLGYAFCEVSPAQFEEMGDLLGMPQTDGKNTYFAPPSWIPQQKGPGILLLDDLNRADERILRGLMPLLLKGEMLSWQLPQHWYIIATANPENDQYNVSTFDEALHSRMMHIYFKTNLQDWLRWANTQNIDKRATNFFIHFPETFDNVANSPRSFTQLFQALAPIQNWREHISLLQMFATACIDEQTAATFVAFAQDEMMHATVMSHWLDTDNFSEEVEKLLYQQCMKENVLRSDILAAYCNKWLNVVAASTALNPKQQQNLSSFLNISFIPGDLLMLLFRKLSALENRPDVAAVLAQPQWSKKWLM